MIRWTLKLEEFNIEWEHRAGTQNAVAYVLWRNPIKSIIGEKVHCAIIRDLISGKPPEDSSVNATICENWFRDFRLIEGLLFYAKYSTSLGEMRVYIPKPLKNEIMREFHDKPLAGHFGRFKIYHKIRDVCYFLENDASLNQCSHKYHFDVAIHRRFDVELSFISMYSTALIIRHRHDRLYAGKSIFLIMGAIGSPVSAKSGSTSNLFGHLRLHHPLQFSEVSNKSKVVVTATVQHSPFCAAVDESIDEPQPHSNMAVSESNQFNFVDNHKHKRQKFMTDFQRLDGQASKRTTDSVTKFLVCTMQPYNLVD
ncbi:hypothetical protein TNCV_497291 [Trichonephila clavipes]|nr:hypothetical protein TNCV_497291 [Trichonephila clavipes]